MCQVTFNLWVIADFPACENFCRCFVQWSAEHFFVSSVLFKDEARFSKDRINIHNEYQWTEENPHSVIHSKHQQQFGINLWAKIVCDCLVGPHVLPHQPSGNHYWDFLLHDLAKLLEDVPLAVRVWMWYIDDGAPAHFSCAVRCSHLSWLMDR
jgi:hypothetical protein